MREGRAEGTRERKSDWDGEGKSGDVKFKGQNGKVLPDDEITAETTGL